MSRIECPRDSGSLFPSLSSLQYLRSSSASPGQTEATLAGVAGRSRLRGGAGSCSMYFISRLCPLVASGSRDLDPIGRIWSILVLVFVAVRLRWQGQVQATELWPEISDNKAASLSVLALGRSAGRLWRSISGKLPRWKIKEGSAASSCEKRCPLHINFLQVPFLRSAGSGCEGEEKQSLEPVGARCGRGFLVPSGVDSAFLLAISKLWRRLAAAIHGHRVGLAMLGLGSSCFFLRSGRIFLCLGAATSVSIDPSGLVPGVDRDGCDWMQFVGGALGLDRVSTVVCRVLSVFFTDLVVIFLMFEVLDVKVYPPPV